MGAGSDVQLVMRDAGTGGQPKASDALVVVPLVEGGVTKAVGRATLAGRVSMDMLAIDLADHPEATVGTPVTLWGRGLPVETVAAHAGTIAYELLCGVTGRVHVASTGALPDR